MKFRIGDKRKNGLLAFGAILPDIIQEFDTEKSFTIELVAAQWHQVVGDIISTHSKPDRLYKNIMYVAADHSVYASEIAMRKDEIIRLINDEFPHITLRDLKIEIKTIRW